MKAHTPFEYDTKFKQCIFENAAIKKADSSWRVRVLPFEDSESIGKSGVIKKRAVRKKMCGAARNTFIISLSKRK